MERTQGKRAQRKASSFDYPLKELEFFMDKYKDLLSFWGQTHLGQEWDGLSYGVQQEIASLLPDLLLQQKNHLSQEKSKKSSLPLWNKYTQSFHLESYQKGKELLLLGKVATLILAGGSGSRLGSSSPKGLLPVTCVLGKSLLQVFCEKTFYAGKKYGTKFPLVILTSPANHQEIKQFLEERGWFGLEEGQVHLLQQGTLPLLSEEGEWFLDPPGMLAQGPDGNGFCLHRLYRSDLWPLLQRQGIEYVTIVPVDNPLADPFDPELVGLQKLEEADVGMKVVKKASPTEKVGVLVSQEGNVRVEEYSEREGKNDVSDALAHTGLFSFSLSFIASLVGDPSKQIPWHLAHKQLPAGQCVWKFEYFLFDVLLYAKRVAVLLAPRSECFSPLKNREGENSIETVRRDLLELDRKKYREITGKEPPSDVLELSSAFYYPIEEKRASMAGTKERLGYYYRLEDE